MIPSWLPNVLSLDGTWEHILNRLYAVFESDFVQGKPLFKEKPVWWDTRKLDGFYEEGFWHLISVKDSLTADRIPDYERARRLTWCAPCITNHRDVSIRCWDFEEAHGNIRTYIWLVDWDYLVILEKRNTRIGEIAFLITAYWISGSSIRKKLETKYKNRRDGD